MSRVLILGSTGSLGLILVNYLKRKNYTIFTDKKYKHKLKKVNNLKILKKIVLLSQPDFIINLVAMTNVDLCEKKKFLAKKSNVLFVRNLINILKKITKKTHLIHISTDQVYSGKGNHSENNAYPINYYGKSKLEGEKIARKVASTIFRVNYVSATEKKKSLSEWIFFNLKRKNIIKTFQNIYFSPLHSSTLVKLLTQSLKIKKYGVFNLGSKNKISKAKFAEKFALGLSLDKDLLKRVNYLPNNSMAKRPLDMSMKVSKFQKYFKIKLPSIETEIKKLIKDFK